MAILPSHAADISTLPKYGKVRRGDFQSGHSIGVTRAHQYNDPTSLKTSLRDEFLEISPCEEKFNLKIVLQVSFKSARNLLGFLYSLKSYLLFCVFYIIKINKTIAGDDKTNRSKPKKSNQTPWCC